MFSCSVRAEFLERQRRRRIQAAPDQLGASDQNVAHRHPQVGAGGTRTPRTRTTGGEGQHRAGEQHGRAEVEYPHTAVWRGEAGDQQLRKGDGEIERDGGHQGDGRGARADDESADV